MSARYPAGVVRKNQVVPAANGASGVWTIGQATQATKSDIWPYNNIAVPIQNSLRFRNSASAFLSRTSVSPTNNKIFTWSGWVKVGMGTSGITGPHNLIDGVVDLDNESVIRLQGNVTFAIFTGGSYKANVDTSATLRDPSAWYHIVVAVDMTQATSTNGIKIYVNGVQQTLTVSTYIQNSATQINSSGATQQIGKDTFSGSNRFADYYLTDVNFVDGQQLTPSSFGSTNAVTGVWQPIQYTGTYGTNGFHLEFKDTTVGKDTSGNNNNWTPNNISTTLGTTYDLMTDVPTQWSPRNTTDVGGVVRGNYATLNPIDAYDNAPTQGNLARIGVGHTGSPWSTCRGTMGVTSGKWYFEATLTGTSGSYQPNSMVGVMTAATSTLSDAYGGSISRSYQANGGLQGDNSTGTASSATSGDVIMCAFDIDAGKVWFGKNGTWFNSGVPASGTGNVFTSVPTSPVVPAVHMYGNTGDNNGWYLNFGQRPFTYTPPTDFKSLCTTNLPTPTIGATVATAANKYFDATLYTGTGATLSVTNAGGFQPDFVWLKSRSAATNHQLFDVVRGTTKVLTTSVLTEAEQTAANTLTSFNSSGFTIGTNTAINTSSSTYVGWQWKAGSSTVTNTTGTISAQVCANPTTGFSIITYAGNSTDSQTVGHGLGITPQMVIVKGRTSTNYWPVWHTSLPSFTYNLYLNTTDNQQSDGQFTSTSSTTVGVRNGGSTNQVGTDFLMYCWAPIAGYSAFGSYTGNGSANGPFVYTGFKPRFIMIKRFDGGVTSWYIVDTAINTYNEALKTNYPNLANAEGTNANFCDFLSNGFKIRESGIAASGASYLYAAWAENPFKTALAR
jgi:hypothetical protein